MMEKALQTAIITQMNTSGYTSYAFKAPSKSTTYPYGVVRASLFDAGDNELYQLLRVELDCWAYEDMLEPYEMAQAIDDVMLGQKVQDLDSTLGSSTVFVRDSTQPIEDPDDDKISRVQVIYSAWYTSRGRAEALGH